MPETIKGELHSISDVIRESLERPTGLNPVTLNRFVDSYRELIESARSDEAKALLAGLEAAVLNMRFRYTGRFWTSKPGRDSISYEYVSDGVLRTFVADKLEQDGAP
jgi:hypothetical protein